MNCKHCNKKLVSIGNKRKNGANHKDWETRSLHKKCYTKISNCVELMERCLNNSNEDNTYYALLEKYLDLKKLLD